MKNNLQIVDSLLVMQMRQTSNQDAKKALRGLQDRVYALGLVRQQLMGSTDLKTFDIAPFLHELSTTHRPRQFEAQRSGPYREIQATRWTWACSTSPFL